MPREFFHVKLTDYMASLLQLDSTAGVRGLHRRDEGYTGTRPALESLAAAYEGVDPSTVAFDNPGVAVHVARTAVKRIRAVLGPEAARDGGYGCHGRRPESKCGARLPRHADPAPLWCPHSPDERDLRARRMAADGFCSICAGVHLKVCRDALDAIRVMAARDLARKGNPALEAIINVVDASLQGE